jgi:uncharacterized membrane protein YhaH (DUF805 family)
MFLGHYGLAFAAKPATADASLGTTVMLANLADEVWPILLCFGVEKVAVDAAAPPNQQFLFLSYPWSHSLLTGLLAALVVAAIIWARKRNAKTALICGALVVSHWLIDLPFHQPDLPLWPGGPLVGFNLWSSVPITLVCEALVFFGGLAIYLRRTKARNRSGSIALYAMVAVLVLIYASGYMGGEPPKADVVGPAGLILWLFVPWSYWINRNRADRT